MPNQIEWRNITNVVREEAVIALENALNEGNNALAMGKIKACVRFMREVRRFSYTIDGIDQSPEIHLSIGPPLALP